jgi:hypothetical protein
VISRGQDIAASRGQAGTPSIIRSDRGAAGRPSAGDFSRGGARVGGRPSAGDVGDHLALANRPASWQGSRSGDNRQAGRQGSDWQRGQGREWQGRDFPGRDSQGREWQGRDFPGRDSQGRDWQGRVGSGRGQWSGGDDFRQGSRWTSLRPNEIDHIRRGVGTAMRRTAGDWNRGDWQRGDRGDWSRSDGRRGDWQRGDWHRNDWLARHPHRRAHWDRWAGNIRGGGWHHSRFHNVFNQRFWAVNFVQFPWPRYHYWWGGQPWSFWWGAPTWQTYVNWFPNWGWEAPFYYDYGPGGNVMFQSGYVYIDGTPIATVDQYAATAAELAVVEPPLNPDQPVDWLPLGTFALSASEADTNPARVLQLAVDPEGNLSGTLFNETTNQTYAVLGRVDRETQRVAFTINGNQDVVLETGIYNLTQDQTPLLAHGEGRTETYMLLRLDPPAEGSSPAAEAAGPMLVP